MAESAELLKIKQQKKVAKAGFTRLENYIKAIDPNTVDIDVLKLKLEKLEAHWKSLEQSLAELPIYEKEASDQEIEQELAIYEEKYINLRVNGERIIKVCMKPTDAAFIVNEPVQANVIPEGVNINRVGINENPIRLPKIELPTFSGAYEDWHPFYDIFNSLIHSNASLNNIQKFHYLKSAVKGEAAETIASLEISDVQYEDAWIRLKERYDNDRIAVQNHIKAIFDLPILRKENSVTLRNLLDGVLKHTRALTALKRPTMQWDDLLVYVVTSKLDYITMKEWEGNINSKTLPTFKQLTDFLSKRCQMLEAVTRRNLSMQTGSSYNSRQTVPGKITTSHAATTSVKCTNCKGDHQIYQCKAFKELSIAERLNKVKLMKLCLNCLKGKHIAKECSSSGCKKCAKKHSTLLHEERNSFEGSKETTTQDTNQKVNKTTNTICTHSQAKELVDVNQALLSTALIKVKNSKEEYIEGRVLLDNGSQSNFVTEEFVKRLGLKTVNDQIKINGINQHVSHASGSVSLKITSRFDTFGMDLSCIVLPQITQNLPLVAVDISSLKIPKNIKLADPCFNIPGKIDLLIGVENFWDLICVGQIRLGKHKPILQKSLLGWLVAGPVGGSKSKKTVQTNCNLSVTEELNESMRKFWEVESYPMKRNVDLEEEYCERHFETTYSRQSDGRFIVKLPVKEDILRLLNNSREIALKRFMSLERRFSKNSEFKNEYVKFMQDYLRLGHMKRVTECNNNNLRVFLPHHAVTKKDSTTTKTRVVFDASSQYSKGKSLNDALYKGPVIQPELFVLILRFRCFKYVLCSDITKMYRQILIHNEQTSLQSIIWRENPESNIEEFELLTVTYGTKPASFLATRCLQQLAKLEEANYPKAAKVICNDFYMDDVLTGGNTESEITTIKKELTELLAKGGFELHKWNTNLQSSDQFVQDKEAVDISKEAKSKLLGILWNPSRDTLHYKVSWNEGDDRVTKRVILSQVCRLFDPLGLIGPIITLAKILIQELWSLGTDWDESVPMHIHKTWKQIRYQLNLLNDLKIPKSVVSGEVDSEIQIHGFCDASEKAYGACIFFREQNSQGEVVVSLLCSKSRVAPMKMLSLPRLELCGAVLLVNLMDRVIANLRIKVRKRFYWTDSMIVLAWISSASRKWHVFVANRVSDIQDKSLPSEWQHVKSKDNPADLISRGTTPEQLMQSKIWWKGPQWLKEDMKLWPKESKELSFDNIPERRNQAVVVTAVKYEACINYKRFSSLNKLLRTTAYILRFIHNLKCKKERRKTAILAVEEINQAKLEIIKLVQAEEFKEKIRALRNKKKIQRNSRLIALHPFLDNNEIARVGGRLKHAVLAEEFKHPVLLPASHHFTKLIIVYHHEKLYHAGVQTTVNAIREEFWPILAKSQVKKVLRNCAKCRKAHPRLSWQLMGELPSVRVNIARPFLNSGVDYCGPFYVRDRIRKNSKKYKAYVAIFVCMVTKAVHIELVEDLTTESFLAALKRFIARRGKVKNIYSDNAKNFVEADRMLQQILEKEEFKEAVQEFATSEKIEWHFIPARSPHYGGLWEAAVRSMKMHLKRTLGEACLTVAEMTTVLAQIEAILNSRPLTPMSEDPNDLRALTPGHFLIGENLQSYPEQDLQDVPENRLTRWQHVEQIKQRLWSRWQKEYLTTCQQRVKWKRDSNSNFEVGQLVMLKEDETIPLKWTLARIVEIHPGSDNVIRAITVQTQKGVYKRSIVNIAPILE